MAKKATRKKKKKDQDLYAHYINGELSIYQGKPVIEVRTVVTSGDLLTTLCSDAARLLLMKEGELVKLDVSIVEHLGIAGDGC